MITREEFFDISGFEDARLTNPFSSDPPFRFGTIPNGATDFVMKNNFPEMHLYMKKFSRRSVKEGTMAVKSGDLDAFIYDATVLEYLVGQDDECNILTVGLGCPRNKNEKNFGSNRNNKPKQYLLRLCFGLFRETKKPKQP
jgi:ionotropic glutamate receptor NMDA 2B